MNNILEIAFQISYNMNISFDFNNMEFYEFIWLHERLANQKQEEKKEEASNKGYQLLSN